MIFSIVNKISHSKRVSYLNDKQCKDYLTEGIPPLLSSWFLSSSLKQVKNTNKLTGWNRLHDLIGLHFIVDLESEEVSGSSELELGNSVSLVLLDRDLFSAWKVLLLSPHNLYEFLQVLNFFWLYTHHSKCRMLTMLLIL